MLNPQPIDQGAILRSGQAAAGNYAEQAIQRALLSIRQQESQTQALNVRSQAAARQRQADRQDALSTAVQELGPNPTAQQLARLMYRFPEMSEDINRGYQAMDSAGQREQFQGVANITSAARSGRYDLAAQLLRARVEADRVAGTPDPYDNAILAALESRDPAQRRVAVDMLERTLAAIEPERYSQVYGTFSRNIQYHNGVYRDGNTGEVIDQDPRIVIPGPNGSFNQLEPLPGVPILGQGGSGIAEQPPRPGFRDHYLTPEQEAAGAGEGGGAGQWAPPQLDTEPGQYPASRGAAPSFNPAQGVSPVAPAQMTPDGPADIADILARQGQAGGGNPVRVRSIQEANRLPAGTPYMTPDGAVYVR